MQSTYVYVIPIEQTGGPMPSAVTPEVALILMDALHEQGIASVAVETIPGYYNVEVVDDVVVAA